MEDHQLLAQFANTGSETAFAELVNRYARIVYTTALRQLGDRHLAQDVSQSVFCLLVRRAKSIGPSTRLVGWLHRATCFVASDVKRAAARRRTRERKAITEDWHSRSVTADEDWRRVAPVLDQALCELGSVDREAVLMRFFQEKSMRQVGEALGISEAAAKMRVSRSIERLRKAFLRQDIRVSTSAIASLMIENSLAAILSPGSSKPATSGRFKTSHHEGGEQGWAAEAAAAYEQWALSVMASSESITAQYFADQVLAFSDNLRLGADGRMTKIL